MHYNKILLAARSNAGSLRGLPELEKKLAMSFGVVGGEEAERPRTEHEGRAASEINRRHEWRGEV